MHKQFLLEAIKLSHENIKNYSGGPFGAVVVKNNEIIATGVNLVTSTNDPTAHAEVIAIRNACKKLKSFQLNECIIYTSCEPCPMCLGSIYWARPKAVYYANTKKDAASINFDDSFIYEEISLPHKERSIQFHHIELPEAYTVFSEWIKQQDKILY